MPTKNGHAQVSLWSYYWVLSRTNSSSVRLIWLHPLQRICKEFCYSCQKKRFKVSTRILLRLRHRPARILFDLYFMHSGGCQVELPIFYIICVFEGFQIERYFWLWESLIPRYSNLDFSVKKFVICYLAFWHYDEFFLKMLLRKSFSSHFHLWNWFHWM